jgi:hypothetical protein
MLAAEVITSLNAGIDYTNPGCTFLHFDFDPWTRERIAE